MALFRICSLCCKNDPPSSIKSVLGGFFPPSSSSTSVFEEFAKDVSFYLGCSKFPPAYFEKQKNASGDGGIIDQHVCKACRPNLETFLGLFEQWLEIGKGVQSQLRNILEVMRGVESDKLEAFNAYQNLALTFNGSPENAGGSGGAGAPPKCLDFKGFRQELVDRFSWDADTSQQMQGTGTSGNAPSRNVSTIPPASGSGGSFVNTGARTPATSSTSQRCQQNLPAYTGQPRQAGTSGNAPSRNVSTVPPASGSGGPFVNTDGGRTPAMSSTSQRRQKLPASASVFRPPIVPAQPIIKKSILTVGVQGSSSAAGDQVQGRQENESPVTFENRSHSSSSPSAVEDLTVLAPASSSAARVPASSRSGLSAGQDQQRGSSPIIITIDDDDDLDYVPPRQGSEIKKRLHGKRPKTLLKGIEIETGTPRMRNAFRERRPSPSNSAVIISDEESLGLDEKGRSYSGQGLEGKKQGKLSDRKQPKRKSTSAPKKKFRFSCDFCDDRFENSRALEFHFRKHHTDEVELHHCVFCAKDFVQPKELEGHMQIHTTEKPFLCRTCALEFGSRSRLEHHQRIHDNMKKGLGRQ